MVKTTVQQNCKKFVKCIVSYFNYCHLLHYLCYLLLDLLTLNSSLVNREYSFWVLLHYPEIERKPVASRERNSLEAKAPFSPSVSGSYAGPHLSFANISIFLCSLSILSLTPVLIVSFNPKEHHELKIKKESVDQFKVHWRKILKMMMRLIQHFKVLIKNALTQ